MKNCIETPCVLDRKCQLFLYKKTLCRNKKDMSGKKHFFKSFHHAAACSRTSNFSQFMIMKNNSNSNPIEMPIANAM